MGFGLVRPAGNQSATRFELYRHVEIARTCSNLVADWFSKPNPITLSWSQTGPKLVAELLACASSLLAS